MQITWSSAVTACPKPTKEHDNCCSNRQKRMRILFGGDSERISSEFRDAGYKDVKVIGRGYFEDLLDKGE